MSAPLLWSSDLDSFEGAPFADGRVLIAGEQIRAACGWHVAPLVTETLRLDVDSPTLTLVLPSKRVTAISAVRDMTGAAPVAITGFAWSRNGLLTLSGGRWPCGLGAIEVDLTHGYDACPADLLDWAAQLARTAGRDSAIRSESVGSVAYTYAGETTVDHPLAEKYRP